MERRKTKTVTIGSVEIGGGRSIVIQSMLKVPTTDIGKCVRLIGKLAAAGCRLVRLAVPTKADSIAFAAIAQKSALPLIADIHFSPARAIEAIEAGAAKIRLNPGNIKNRNDILRIIDAAKMHKVAIRIGVNEASIRDLKKDTPPEKRTALMLREMKNYVRLFERRGFNNIVLSAKSADTIRTIEVNRAIAAAFDYPLHIGLTHAGLVEDASVPSAVAIGTLLAEGIGDTIRVSLAADPVQEVQLAKQILKSLRLYRDNQAELVVCPTCGRCRIDVVRLAKQVKKLLTASNKMNRGTGILRTAERPLRIAVMGCVVNGPGEAADADLAVCAAEGKGFIYRRGRKIAVVPETQLLGTIRRELLKL